MFTGFTEETIQFFLDLKFHNSTSYFHEHHDRYVESVQQVFYDFIDELAPDMQEIDPQMEVRPHKCLSRIHRDTRFSKDKSPYRDHLWLLFRRAAEPREKALMYWFEFGPGRLSWGMGFWGENREALDLFRKRMQANPERMLTLLDTLGMEKRNLHLDGTAHKRMSIPSEIPPRLTQWYAAKEMYISKMNPEMNWAFSERIVTEVRKDFISLAPLYRLLRGYCDEAAEQDGD